MSIAHVCKLFLILKYAIFMEKNPLQQYSLNSIALSEIKDYNIYV